MTLADLVRGGEDPGQYSTPYVGTWNAPEADPKYPYRDLFSYLGYSSPSSGPGGDDPGTFLPPPGPGSDVDGKWMPGEKYRGIVDYSVTPGGGDDPRTDRRTTIDWSKLPAPGRFQGTELAPFGPNSNIINNPSMTYEDPNYGWITPQGNVKQGLQDQIFGLTPALIMALAGGAFGSVVGPALSGGLNLAGNSLLSGKINPIGAAATAAGIGGVDPGLISLAKIAYGLGKP